jgi:hypothetical protein
MLGTLLKHKLFLRRFGKTNNNGSSDFSLSLEIG